MPPWDAPRDAVSYIEATGLEVLASGYLATSQTVAQLLVTIDGQEVEVPAYVGIDRVRNVEAPLHTHQDDGTIWVEHPREAPETTVGEFFDLWGVRFDERCVGAACTGLTVRVDGKPIPADQDPRAIEWTTDLVVQIDARS